MNKKGQLIQPAWPMIIPVIIALIILTMIGITVGSVTSEAVCALHIDNNYWGNSPKLNCDEFFSHQNDVDNGNQYCLQEASSLFSIDKNNYSCEIHCCMIDGALGNLFKPAIPSYHACICQKK